MGLIVPPQDSHALAQALIQILTNPGSFQGETDQIARKYAPDTITQRYEQVFQELLLRRRQAERY
jgi:glycosyltransferase involved in cell wall biosynthesis